MKNKCENIFGDGQAFDWNTGYWSPVFPFKKPNLKKKIETKYKNISHNADHMRLTQTALTEFVSVDGAGSLFAKLGVEITALFREVSLYTLLFAVIFSIIQGDQLPSIFKKCTIFIMWVSFINTR